MAQSKQSKLEQSKSEYGTLTAKMDANNDYSSSTSQSTTSATSSTSANMSELSKLAQQSQTTSSTNSAANSSKLEKANQTLTAKYDANGDYSAE